jgi:predicted MPP superfamily phosphohydrolase
VIREYEVSLSGLPNAMDGTVLVALSDMHLGSLLSKGWLTARIAQVKAQRPDLVVILGDTFEGHGPPEDHLVAAFKQLSAPLGVWAVSGNHEFHGEDKISLLEKSGFRLLSNNWTEVRPGLILSGVDDLTTWRRNGQEGDPISQALVGRPAGATIFLSHTPWKAERISKAGVGLMLSGHTHGGQIWPFDYLVRNRYPLLEGRYEVDGMTVIVCRGNRHMGTAHETLASE